MTLLDLLREKGIPVLQVKERVTKNYDCPFTYANMNGYLKSGKPQKTEKWEKIQACLKNDFGIEYKDGEWTASGMMTVKPMGTLPKGGMNNPITARANCVKGDTELVSKLMTEAYQAYKMSKVKSDEEMMERFDQYFRMCAETGRIPTVEEMCMYTGYSDSYIWAVEVGTLKGFSSKTAEIIKHAKSMMKVFDAKLVVSGKLNFLTYCFRAKNYYGMVDKQEYVVTPNQKPENDFDAEEIRKRYAIETTFSEESD